MEVIFYLVAIAIAYWLSMKALGGMSLPAPVAKGVTFVISAISFLLAVLVMSSIFFGFPTLPRLHLP